MHYLITGHTGFKGSWLALMLSKQGHKVSGLALDPLPDSLFESADVASDLANDFRIDIRDANSTQEAINSIRPDVVMHLAAQPLVRASYIDPRGTFDTNVMGTLNVLESVSNTPSVKAHLVVTTDKVYRNVNQVAGYVETDALGGFDPYSSSKAAADILTQSWVKSFPGAPTAIARAGNVIGGGDVSQDRLLVDLISAFKRGESPEIRYPTAVRPWQHVLDCLNGYLVLTDALLRGEVEGEWNFGPGNESFIPVSDIATQTANLWGNAATWTHDVNENPHEAELLALDASKAQNLLGWRNLLPYPSSLEWTVDWYKKTQKLDNVREVTLAQIDAFENLKQC